MKRNSQQNLIPEKIAETKDDGYDVYPAHRISQGKIKSGYKTLAAELSTKKLILIDGYVGVDWEEVIDNIQALLTDAGKKLEVIDIRSCLKNEEEINKITAPFLGKVDSIFGHRTSLDLIDYFDADKIADIKLSNDADIQIVYGTGASLCGHEGYLVYVDVPKNEIQYRMKAGAINNLGYSAPKDAKQMYKHFYFIDWIVLNKEKKKLLPKIGIIVDQQRPLLPTWMDGNALRNALSEMSNSSFRVRPWFEPGVWGGQWIMDKIQGLNKNVPNYAWSFEMIVPENGLLLEDEGILLEISFDMLMFQAGNNVLGKAFSRFRDEFPIRFDFLDTFDGGNLSVQCHPTNDYIKKEFGENFTQDETYYILDSGKDAEVYLGFQEGINPVEFRKALEQAYKTKEILDVEKYVQKFKASKHDLFLIPNGTIHCSGINNMVLEISATPYIFTFKMYDWQRLDLDGLPRPLNIDHAFKNLDFDRQGQNVIDTLISKPVVNLLGKDWKKIHLPTHADHFYEIWRYEFENEIEIETHDQCHLLMLVEGTTIELIVEGHIPQKFHYAETFAIPAAAKKYKIVNKGDEMAKVIVSFVKDEACLS